MASPLLVQLCACLGALVIPCRS